MSNPQQPAASEVSYDSTVADLVIERPSRAAVFHKYKIDYYCGGQHTLAEVCSRQDIDAAQLVNELDAISDNGGSELARATIGQLCEHITSVHHNYMKNELPEISILLDELIGEYSLESLPELRSIFLSMKSEMQEHTKKEEKALFPMARVLEESEVLPSFHCGSLRNPLSVMESDHDSTTADLSKIRVLTDQFMAPDDAPGKYIELLERLERLERDVHLHIHKENNLLHPMIRAREAELEKAEHLKQR